MWACEEENEERTRRKEEAIRCKGQRCGGQNLINIFAMERRAEFSLDEGVWACEEENEERTRRREEAIFWYKGQRSGLKEQC